MNKKAWDDLEKYIDGMSDEERTNTLRSAIEESRNISNDITVSEVIETSYKIMRCDVMVNYDIKKEYGDMCENLKGLNLTLADFIDNIKKRCLRVATTYMPYTHQDVENYISLIGQDVHQNAEPISRINKIIDNLFGSINGDLDAIFIETCFGEKVEILVNNMVSCDILNIDFESLRRKDESYIIPNIPLGIDAVVKPDTYRHIKQYVGYIGFICQKVNHHVQSKTFTKFTDINSFGVCGVAQREIDALISIYLLHLQITHCGSPTIIQNTIMKKLNRKGGK